MAAMHPFLEDIKTFTLDTLFPIYCLVCKKTGGFICSECLHKLIQLEHQYCIVCKKPSPQGTTHPKCSNQHTPDGTLSFLNYRDTNVAEAIILGKYKFITKIYKIFGQQLAQYLIPLQNYFQDFIIVPIPLSATRQRWRGFNQAELLCNELQTRLNLPIAKILIRQKATKTQKDLKKEARLVNMKDSFAISKSTFIDSPKNIILVDDVVTTGVTLLEATKVLKRAGANKVWCLTLAKD